MTTHVTTISFTGAGCRARCLTRGCNWTGPNHMAIPTTMMAVAWHQAQTDGRHHVTDQLREQRRKGQSR